MFEPFVGDILYDFKLTTFFMAILRIYFLFFTYEIKCGTVAFNNVNR